MVATARTAGDLTQALGDLAGTGAAVAVAAPALPMHLPIPGHAPDDPLVLAAGASSVKRTGRWEVPGWLTVSSGLGSVKLNCLEAFTRYAVIDVTVTSGLGSVTLIVPDGWAANIDRLRHGWGSARSKVATIPEAGMPVLFVHGSTGVGSLRIRYARGSERRRLGRRGGGRTS